VVEAGTGSWTSRGLNPAEMKLKGVVEGEALVVKLVVRVLGRGTRMSRQS